MRKIAILSTLLSLALVSSAWAGAKDKSSNTLVDINNTGVISNTLVKTKVKSKGCSLQIQIKPIALPDDAVVICIADADAIAPPSAPAPGLGNSVIMTGEVKAGQLKLKADLTEAKFLTVGCGSVDALSFNTNVRCFTDDAVFRGDANVPGSWRAVCAADGMTAAFAPGDAPGPTKLKVNDTQSVVVGICQGFTPGTRISGPSSPEFARLGARAAIE